LSLQHQHERADALLEELATVTRRAERCIHRLIDRAAILQWDGYPERSSSATPEGHGSAAVTDAMAERIVTRLDGEHVERDPVAGAVADAWKALHEMRFWARIADRALARAQHVPLTDQERERADGVPACVNCARFEVFAVAARAGRCWPCYQFRRRHDGRDRPERLVRAEQQLEARRASASG